MASDVTIAAFLLSPKAPLHITSSSSGSPRIAATANQQHKHPSIMCVAMCRLSLRPEALVMLILPRSHVEAAIADRPVRKQCAQVGF